MVIRRDGAQCGRGFRDKRRITRGRQAVVETARERTGVAVAGRVGMFAGFVARDQLEYAKRRAFAQRVERVQRQLASRAFCAEEEDLLELLAGAMP
jgi:hypothetical protein